MDGPILYRVVNPAGKAVRALVYGADNVVRVVAKKRPPARRRTIIIQHARGKYGAISPVAIVFEPEVKIVRRVQKEIERSKSPHGRPVVIRG